MIAALSNGGSRATQCSILSLYFSFTAVMGLPSFVASHALACKLLISSAHCRRTEGWWPQVRLSLISVSRSPVIACRANDMETYLVGCDCLLAAKRYTCGLSGRCTPWRWHNLLSSNIHQGSTNNHFKVERTQLHQKSRPLQQAYF